MKIEIGESLLLSWLRHVKGCQLVQMNWKPSISSWELQNEKELNELMYTAASFYSNKYQYQLFKNNSFTQLLQQAEVDVLGMSFGIEGEKDLYAIDVAFHEAGLNYGDKEETVSRVIKKLIRTAFIFNGYFYSKTGTIIFASPKIHKAVETELTPRIQELNAFMNQLGYPFTFKLYANNDFYEKVLEPVIAASESVADTSELFMRSLQLYNLFISNEDQQKTRLTKKYAKVEVRNISGMNEMKIGMFVRSTMRSQRIKSLMR